MATQHNLQERGENLLSTVLKGINVFLSPFFSEFKNFDQIREMSILDKNYDSDLPVEVLRSLIFYEIPAIFKLGNSLSDSINFHVTLINIIDARNDLMLFKMQKCNKKNISYIKKLTQKYNKCLNKIIQSLKVDFTEDRDILEKRSIISRMMLYKVGSFFELDMIDRSRKIADSKSQVIESTEMRFINYDGMHRMTDERIVLRVPKTFNRQTQQPGQGVSFSFESKEDFFRMIRSSVETATINQLSYEVDDSRSFGGVLINGRYVFQIKLLLQHGLGLNAEIDSSSTKIMHNLRNGSVTHDMMRSVFSKKPFLGMYQMMGLYADYHSLVTKKIYQLINASFSKPDFPLICIECFRPDCGHKNLFNRHVEGFHHEDICQKCHIAEFCLLCGKVSHGGICDTTPDEWIALNTKVCPGCRAFVEKDGGCNHMQCTTCNTHFCWICNQSYSYDKISEHYQNFDSFGNCRGM
jgi:hypothetical protein